MSNPKDPPPPYAPPEMPNVHQYNYSTYGPAPYPTMPQMQPQPQYGFYTAQPAPPPSYGATTTHTVIVPAQSEIIVVGGCPSCRIGVLQDDFTCMGLLCAILFFPAGILCCLLMREKRCTNCGAQF